MDQNHAIQAKHVCGVGMNCHCGNNPTKQFLSRYARRWARQELHVSVVHKDDDEYPLMKRCE